MVKSLLKIGNSIAITLPPEEIKRLRLKPGDRVEIYADGQALRIVPLKKVKAIALGGVCKGVDLSEAAIAKVRREAWGRDLS